MELPSQDKNNNNPHVAICPSAGIGHLVPFLNLAAMFADYNYNNNCSHNIKVTLITIRPTLSTAEENQISTFLKTHPHIHSLDIHLPCPVAATAAAPNGGAAISGTAGGEGPDPFFLRYDAIFRSAHLLTRHLSSLSPPLSAVFSDIMFATGFAAELINIPNYVVVTTSARFFSLTAYLPRVTAESTHQMIELAPGFPPIPKTSIPPLFFNPNHIFTKMIATNTSWLHKAKGVLLNSFDSLEPDTISALRTGNKLTSITQLPKIFPIGPLKSATVGPTKNKNNDNPITNWLDRQPAKSVVYISFGSRTAMGKDQIRELRDGLNKSGVRFLWVIKTMTVDKEDKNEAEVRDFLGEGFMESTKTRGVVIKDWVDQEEILSHPSVGGFVSHCGWNSVVETARRGVPVVAWPQHGDQKVNAAVVEASGLGVWDKGWGWIGERLVKGDEIGEKIKEVMSCEVVRSTAVRVGDEADKAWESPNGSSFKMLESIIVEISKGGQKLER